MKARRAACALLPAASLLIAFACTTPEPAPTPQPTARSLLPPSATPDASASPSSAADESMPRGADAAVGAPAPEPPAKSAATPSPRATRKPKPELPGISGQVLAGGSPVTDGQVTISGSGYHHNTTTSSSGRFQSATSPGTYTITVSSPSVSCAPKTVTVERDTVSHVTITCSG